VPPEALRSVFEAARWAPSCFNAQPWRFLYAVQAADHARFAGLLAEGNRRWAVHAPVLGLVLAQNRFAHNDKPNRWAPFDAGAAALSLALEAHAIGLAAHFMGGFDQAACYEALGIPRDDWTAMAAFALGYPGDPATLPEDLRDREQPSDRKPPEQVAVEGRFA